MKRGFTIVELLVTVSLIGILSAIVVGGISTARGDARDKQRLAAVEQVKLALEIYREAYGQYPDTGCDRNTNQWTGHGELWGDCDEYIEGLDNILTLPVDPLKDEDGGYVYRTNADFSEYKFMAFNVVETEVLTVDDEYTRYPAVCGTSLSDPNSKSYAVYSAGAQCW